VVKLWKLGFPMDKEAQMPECCSNLQHWKLIVVML
jgi:hypothetical protein